MKTITRPDWWGVYGRRVHPEGQRFIPGIIWHRRNADLEPALRASIKTIVDVLDNCPGIFPNYGLTANLTPEQKAWRAKLQAKVKQHRAALEQVAP